MARSPVILSAPSCSKKAIPHESMREGVSGAAGIAGGGGGLWVAAPGVLVAAAAAGEFDECWS